MDGSVYVIDYHDIAGYDVDSLRLGGTLGITRPDWMTEAGAHVAYSFLDGNEFTLEPQFSMGANRWLKHGHSRLRLRYEISRINTLDSQYSYLGGWRHRANARVTRIHGARQLHLMYQLETNNREELTAPRYTSYSPTRNSLRLIAETPVNNALDATFEVQYYHSRYLHPNELADGSSITRSDDRLSAAVRLIHRFSGGNELALEHRRTDNRSNIDEYDYSQYMTMIGWLLAF